MFYSPGPLPGTNGSSNPEKTQQNIFVHDHQNNKKSTKILVSNNSGVFDAFLWSVLEVRSHDRMQACSIFSQQHNLETLTWGISTQTRASNIGCSKHRSGAYYWWSHYSNREQRNKHRWESLIGQAMSDIMWSEVCGGRLCTVMSKPVNFQTRQLKSNLSGKHLGHLSSLYEK